MPNESEGESHDEEPNDRLEPVLQSHIVQLMEHCDTVQIIVTRYDAETCETIALSRGAGNWYGRKASLKACLKEMK